MSTALTRDRWPLGWTPSANDTNGNPQGLLRMDNLQLDDLGALTLSRGFKNINTSQFPGYVHSLSSTEIFNVKHRFVGLSTGQVLHAADGVNFSDEILSGGNTARARFTDALGTIFVASGAKKKKYDGTNKWNWGIESPAHYVGIIANNQQIYDVSGVNGGGSYASWESVEGANFSGDNAGAHIDSDSDTLRAIVGIRYSKDFNAFPGGGRGLPTDIFSFRARLGDSTRVDKIRVEVALGPIDDLSSLVEYFWMEWVHGDDAPFVEGADNYSTLQCTREQFTRAGDDTTLDWSNVTGLRVSIICTASSLDNLVTGFQLTGSSLGPLNGDIEYVQVNVRDNGIYVGKSATSPRRPAALTVINASIEITPVALSDSQITHQWFFRQGGKLNAFYRVGVLDLTTGIYTDSAGVTSTGTITDSCSDEKVQDLGIIANESLLSIVDIPDEFISIVDGMYFERLVICTQGEILLTDRLNPEAIDNRFRLRVSGDKTESICWISKIANTLLLVGTTKNNYELSGTLEEQPDGTIDANIRPLGEKHPTLGLEFALDSGSVIYTAEDGVRLTRGGPSELISVPLDLLFKSKTRYEIANVQIFTNALATYPIVIYKGQIFCNFPLADGSRSSFVYDLRLQYWRLWECNPISLFVEKDGTLLGGFGNPNDYYIKQLDVGSTIDTQGVTGTGQRLYFQTVYDDNEQPRNRKDALTLKLLINTGDKPVNVYISGDSGGWLSLGQVKTPYLQNVFFDLYSTITETFGLGFRYGIRITSDGYNLNEFTLSRVILEYDPRPELVTSQRLLPTNLGSFCRKRFTNFAFVVDTLGFSVRFQPAIDGVNVGDPITFSHVGKKTVIYYFVSEQIGTDIGGSLVAVDNTATPVTYNNRGAFEYYGPNLDEIVSEKLPTPVKYLKIPANDYGNPNRKRHSSYKFQINTNSKNVRFTPILDGVAQSAATFNTSEKRTVEYFFTTDTTGIDIGGTLASLEDTPFEYYGTIIPQIIEVLPPRLKEFRIPENNYGIAAKKRIRTMPMEINTNGHDVTFTPIVDGTSQSSSTINTPSRTTAFHYFSTDIFGIDYSGELIGAFPFEFYGLLKPETVEVLPVSKKFDQVGPVHLARVGKIVGFRIRIITGEANLPWGIYAEEELIASGTITTTPGNDDVYEQEWLSKGRIAVIDRMVIGPTSVPFNRYYVEFKVNYGGNSDAIKRIRVEDAFMMAQR